MFGCGLCNFNVKRPFVNALENHYAENHKGFEWQPGVDAYAVCDFCEVKRLREQTFDLKSDFVEEQFFQILKIQNSNAQNKDHYKLYQSKGKEKRLFF